MKTSQANTPGGRPNAENMLLGQVLFGRFKLPDQSEHPCSVTGVNAAGAEIRSAYVPDYGVEVVVHLEHFGRIKAVARDRIAGGFKLEFLLDGVKRNLFLSRLEWLSNKNSGGAQDDRQYNRRQLNGARSRVTLSDGRQFPCEIVDVSLTGAAVACTVLPDIGSKVYLGKMLGSVMRHIENGFAIEFLTAFGSDFLADIIIDDPQQQG